MTDTEPKKKPKGRRVVKKSAAQKKQESECNALMYPPVGEDLSYTHPVFSQCVLPMRNKKDRTEWQVEHGSVSMHIQSGVVADGRSRKMVRTDVPYGAAGRVGMSHIHNHIVRAGSLDEACNVDLGVSLRAYCDKYGLSIGGKNGKAIQRQMVNIAQAKITLGLFTDRGARTVNIPSVADKLDFWLEENERQESIWKPSLTVNPAYAEVVRERSQPQDMRVIITLYENVGAMDVYNWLTYRLPLVKDVRGIFIPYDGQYGLHGIFGKGIADKYKFRQAFKGWLAVALRFYPEARVDEEEKGIRIFNAYPVIPPEVANGRSRFFIEKS